MELLTMKVADGSIADLDKIVWKYLAIQAHSNTLSTLSKQQRELDRQGNRLLVPAIIAPLPFGRLGIEDNIEGKLRQTCLNVTTCSSIVTSNDVAPVSLTVNKQVLLSELNKRILN